MITFHYRICQNGIYTLFNKKKSLFLANIKFEPAFSRVLWRFLSAGALDFQARAEGRGVGREFRPRLNFAQIRSYFFANSEPAGTIGVFRQNSPAPFGQKFKFFALSGGRTPKANFSFFNFNRLQYG